MIEISNSGGSKAWLSRAVLEESQNMWHCAQLVDNIGLDIFFSH
jgi:hypothetical protein